MKVRFIAHLSQHAPEDFVRMFSKPVIPGNGHYLSCTELAASSVPGWIRAVVQAEGMPQPQQLVALHIPREWLTWIAEQERLFQGLSPEA